MSRDNIYKDTIERWGVDAQIEMAVEELAELILVLKHWKRGRVNFDAVQTEIADVEIMCAQLRVIFDNNNAVDIEKERKLTRLAARVYGLEDAKMGELDVSTT